MWTRTLSLTPDELTCLDQSLNRYYHLHWDPRAEYAPAVVPELPKGAIVVRLSCYRVTTASTLLRSPSVTTVVSPESPVGMEWLRPPCPTPDGIR